MVVGLSLVAYKGFVHPTEGQANAVLGFAMSVGHTASVGLGIPIAYGALGAMLLLEGFLVTTLDTAIRLTRYMIEEGWATFFGHYDVFADKTTATRAIDNLGPRGAAEMTGAAGLSIERPDLRDQPVLPRPIPTSGALRGLLLTLRWYWINSAIAVALMLTLGWGNGWKKLWTIFGASNQLLAALALIIASCWLAAKARPVWYTLLPTIFMLATSVFALLREMVLHYYPGLPNGGNPPLFITAIIVLAMTLGILASAVSRYIFRRRTTAIAAA
jgi:carbon starvation protein